jgi:hypothetical protein
MLSGLASLFAREALAARSVASAEGQARTVAHLARVVAQGRHPHLAAALSAGADPGDRGDRGTTDAAEDLFERIVAGVLTGLLGPSARQP